MKRQWRHEKVFRTILETVPREARILELGPREGEMLFRLQQNGYLHLDWLDLQDSIAYPEVRTAFPGMLANLNVDTVPRPDASFDLIIAQQIMEHLENPWHFERECARLLKRGGRLLLSIPYGYSLPSKLRFFFSANIMRYERENGHIAFLPKNVFNKLFLKDFELTNIDYSTPTLKQLGWNQTLPSTRFFKKHFATNIYYDLRRK